MDIVEVLIVDLKLNELYLKLNKLLIIVDNNLNAIYFRLNDNK